MRKESHVADVETVDCPLCARNAAEPWLHVVDPAAPEQGAVWPLQRCGACSLIFLNPRPTEIASTEFYRHAGYLPFSSAVTAKNAYAHLYGWLRRYNLRWKRRAITAFHKRGLPFSGRLLDVGCGTGEFLQEMQHAGWEVAGIERDLDAAQFAREHLHLKVMTGSVDDLAKAGDQFDVITLWHVLEHLYRPREVLQSLSKLLGSDGVVVIAVPNIAGVDAKFYGSYWVALDAPRHVQHFSLATLQNLAASVGLKLQKWHQLPLDAFFNALMSERLQASISETSRISWPLRLMRSLLVACASLLTGSRNVLFSGKRGATIVAYFVKLDSKPQC